MNRTEYLLACIAEEGGEISQAAMKSGRFGLFDTRPQKEGGGQNIKLLVAEINDLLGVAEMLKESGLNDFANIGDRTAIDDKKAKVEHWMKYSREVGCLE